MSDMSAKIPPSPRFDARVIPKMYFTLTTNTSNHNTSDINPSMKS